MDTSFHDRLVADQMKDPDFKAEYECAAPCADSRCEHPRGWHRHGVGSCLECGCSQYQPTATRIGNSRFVGRPIEDEDAEPESQARMIVPPGDEVCGEPKDLCRCMKRKGHDGSHQCAHGTYG